MRSLSCNGKGHWVPDTFTRAVGNFAKLPVNLSNFLRLFKFTNTVSNFAKLPVNMSNKVGLSKFTNTVGNYAKLPVNLNNKIKLFKFTKGLVIMHNYWKLCIITNYSNLP